MNGNVESFNYMWIPVEASRGMFDSEMAVVLTLSNGKKTSLFVDK